MKKLTLSKEKLRTLTAQEAVQVGGGGEPTRLATNCIDLSYRPGCFNYTLPPQGSVRICAQSQQPTGCNPTVSGP